MSYVLAAGAASGIFVVAGWRSKRARTSAAARGPLGVPVDPLWGDADIDINEIDSDADVGGAIRLALKRLAPVMAHQSVRAEVAAPSGLVGRIRGGALTDMLEELLAVTMRSAPASRLLLTAVTLGDRICIGITDDMPGSDQAARMASLRGLMERVAMGGGALEVDVRPAEGTTIILRLAAVTEDNKTG